MNMIVMPVLQFPSEFEITDSEKEKIRRRPKTSEEIRLQMEVYFSWRRYYVQNDMVRKAEWKKDEKKMWRDARVARIYLEWHDPTFPKYKKMSK